MNRRARRIRPADLGRSVGGAVAVGLLALGTALAVTGCASGAELSSATTPVPTATVTGAAADLGAGFWDPDNPPAPEGTLDPVDGSWDAVHPEPGYTVVLLTYGDDPATATLVSAVQSWASEEGVDLTTSVAPSTDVLLDTVETAIAAQPDLIISAGEELVDPLAALTPSFLAQQFLVIGAETAEPTANVTAADWTGAGFRGEGLGTAADYDASTFTAERAARAVRAGVAAVLSGITGVVVWVD